MSRILAIALGLSFLVGLPAAIAESPPAGTSWSLRDGDRVAFIGGTFIEREQRYGYLETALTIANPDKTITFRNLGWSGDTIGGVSRSGFDPPEAGFKQLVDQVNAVKPTVIVVGYGANEAFAGKAGLDAFVKGLERVVTALKPLNARYIYLAPLKQENLGAPLPNPEKHNKDIEIYSKGIEEFAKKHGAEFFKLDPLGTQEASGRGSRLTDNGVHLTALGYWWLANRLATLSQTSAELRKPKVLLKITDTGLALGTMSGDHLSLADPEWTKGGIRFRVKTVPLPMPHYPIRSADARAEITGRMLTVEGLEAGHYRLEIDGQSVASATSGEWSRGVAVEDYPDQAQVEQLRQTIIKKNELFFHRWRPQNITYLFGFRKHEQGNNAVEIPQFDPLVAEQEQKIATLKKPVPHLYELVREDAKGGAK